MVATLHDLLKIPLKQTENRTRKLAVIDCETDPFKCGRLPKPFIWGFYDGEIYKEFDILDDLLAFFAQQQEENNIYYRVYAHNGGKFDYHFMLDHLNTGSNVMIINGRLSKFTIGDTEFRDSYNLFNFPLAAYKKDDFDYRLMEEDERNKPENKKKISIYLRKDCVYLYELVDNFIEKYGLSLTQASAAMRIWQKMCDIKAPETNAKYYDSLKEYYYGGRTECFKKGIINKPFKLIDITSAYPFAMYSRHPFSEEYRTLYNKKANSYIAEKGGLMADCFKACFFKIIARSGGALPYRDKQANKLVFPKDYLPRAFTVTGWELQAGIRTGTLKNIRVLEIKEWKTLIDFRPYIDSFFKLKHDAKLAGDRLTELFAKLFLNALYGKFAADPRQYKSFTLIDPHEMRDYMDRGYQEGGFLGPWFVAKRDLIEERQRFYNIATAASITGYVRAYLWEAACKCDGLLYSDTDSIAAHDIGDIQFGDELGDWSLEAECSSGAIAGRKMYAFKYTNSKKGKEYKTASKGVRLTPEQIIKVAKGEEIIYDPEAPTYSVKHEPRFTQRKVVRT